MTETGVFLNLIVNDDNNFKKYEKFNLEISVILICTCTLNSNTLDDSNALGYIVLLIKPTSLLIFVT